VLTIFSQDDKTKQDVGVIYSCIYFVHLTFQLYCIWIGTGTKSIIKYTIQVLRKVNADTDTDTDNDEVGQWPVYIRMQIVVHDKCRIA